MVGSIISHYRVVEKLGGGGMGVVYKAEDTRLKRLVALKFLPREMERNPSALERFRREAEAASALNHPNICTIHDGDEGTGAYMSPEQVRGEDLDARNELLSFGLVLYEMATGQLAFTGRTSGIIMEAILNRAPIPASAMNSQVLPQLEEIISKAIERDRQLRYQSAAEMRADLQRLKRDTVSGSLSATRSAGRGAPSPPGTVAPTLPLTFLPPHCTPPTTLPLLIPS